MNKFRRFLYRFAAILGHLNALNRALSKKSAKPIINRIVRTYMWRGWNSFAFKLFKGF